MKKVKKTLILLVILTFMFSSISFASTSTPDKFGGSTRSVAWVPHGKFYQPTKNGTTYSRVIYLTKLEAIAIAEGYRDSDFKKELTQVLDYAQRTASYSGSFVAGKKIVEIATKLGFKKVASFFSGIGGAIAIGFVVDDFLNFIRDVDYNLFKEAINNTNDNYWVQIKVGIASSPFVTVPVKEYKAWNSTTLEGLAGWHGQWVGPFAEPIIQLPPTLWGD